MQCRQSFVTAVDNNFVQQPSFVPDVAMHSMTTHEMVILFFDAFDDYTRDGHIRAFDWDTFVNATAHNQIRLGLRQCYFNMDQ